MLMSLLPFVAASVNARMLLLKRTMLDLISLLLLMMLFRIASPTS
jgi:hypothetical protein